MTHAVTPKLTRRTCQPKQQPSSGEMGDTFPGTSEKNRKKTQRNSGRSSPKKSTGFQAPEINTDSVKKLESTGKTRINGFREVNSYKGYPVTEAMRRVKKFIENKDVEVTAFEIAEELGMNVNSVRVYVRVLFAKGLIGSPRRGYYSARLISEGVGSGSVFSLGDVSSLGLHGLVLRGKVGVDVVGCWCGGKARVVFDNAFLTVRILGYESGTVMVYVGCKAAHSLDCSSFSLLVAFVGRILGVDISDWEAVGYEFNRDMVGVKLDGIKGVTVKTLDGVLKRAYQKSRNVLRVEAKANTPLSVVQVEALLQGGIPAYNLAQTVAMLVNETRDEREAQKFMNELLHRLLVVNEKLLERMLKDEKA